MKKLSMAQANMMMEEGLIKDQAHLEQLQRNGKVAGLREKESYRLKGVSGDSKITACMPSSKVTIAGKKTYKDLNQHDQDIVDVFKKALNDEVRPIYERVRAQFTERVIVTQ